MLRILFRHFGQRCRAKEEEFKRHLAASNDAFGFDAKSPGRNS